MAAAITPPSPSGTSPTIAYTRDGNAESVSFRELVRRFSILANSAWLRLGVSSSPLPAWVGITGAIGIRENAPGIAETGTRSIVDLPLMIQAWMLEDGNPVVQSGYRDVVQRKGVTVWLVREMLKTVFGTDDIQTADTLLSDPYSSWAERKLSADAAATPTPTPTPAHIPASTGHLSSDFSLPGCPNFRGDFRLNLGAQSAMYNGPELIRNAQRALQEWMVSGQAYTDPSVPGLVTSHISMTVDGKIGPGTALALSLFVRRAHSMASLADAVLQEARHGAVGASTMKAVFMAGQGALLTVPACATFPAFYGVFPGASRAGTGVVINTIETTPNQAIAKTGSAFPWAPVLVGTAMVAVGGVGIWYVLKK